MLEQGKKVENFKLIKYLKFSIKPCNKPSILINSQGFDKQKISERKSGFTYNAEAGSQLG